MVIRNLCILVLWMKVALFLEGLRVSLEIVICVFDTFDDNLEIKDLRNYLKESCCNILMNNSHSYFFLMILEERFQQNWISYNFIQK